jgi:SAM-dependent methyltransferase
MIDREITVCNLCGSGRSRPYLRKFGQPIVKCLRCGLVYVNPRLPENELFKRYNQDYFVKEYLPAFGATAGDFSLDVALNRYGLFFEILRKSALPGRRVLDIGAGAGFFVKAARHLGWDAEGIEFSETAAAYGRNILQVPLQTGKFGALEIPPASFDAVVMLDTLEHLRDPLGDLRKAREILKPDGLLLLHTPDLRSLSRFFLGQGWAAFSPEEHLYYFRRKTLANILRKAGFESVEIRNLTQFNPDYTHDKTTRRYRRWKIRYDRWYATPLRMKIEKYERKEILRMIERRNGSRPPILPDDSPLDVSVSGGIRFRRKMYAAAKRVFRGDQLLAVAGGVRS